MPGATYAYHYGVRFGYQGTIVAQRIQPEKSKSFSILVGKIRANDLKQSTTSKTRVIKMFFFCYSEQKVGPQASKLLTNLEKRL